MLSLVDFSLIIQQHYENLLDDSNKNKFIIIALFFIIPTTISFILVVSNHLLTESIISNLIVAFTIFTAFLPNVIFIQLGMRKQIKEDKNFSPDSLTVSEHLYTDSVYSLLVSILILSILLLFLITNQMGSIVSLIMYSLIIHFLITFLMVVQRVFILFYPKG